MNVQQIVAEWLTARGYDGLAGDECGCGVDDLFPCGFDCDCQPAHRHPATEEEASKYFCSTGDMIYVADEEVAP